MALFVVKSIHIHINIISIHIHKDQVMDLSKMPFPKPWFWFEPQPLLTRMNVRVCRPACHINTPYTGCGWCEPWMPVSVIACSGWVKRGEEWLWWVLITMVMAGVGAGQGDKPLGPRRAITGPNLHQHAKLPTTTMRAHNDKWIHYAVYLLKIPCSPCC